MGVVVEATDGIERSAAGDLFQAVFDNPEIGVALIDARGVVRRLNHAARRVLGRSIHRLSDLDDGGNSPAAMEAIARAMREGSAGFNRIIVRPVGRRDRVRVTLATSRGRGPLGNEFVALFREADPVRATETTTSSSHRDALTGIPNRVWFFERLRRVIDQARGGASNYAVLFIDLDRFKTINDSLGHPIGDELLIEMARRLLGALRPGDTLARLGGDEFAVLAEDLRGPSDAERVAERVRSVLEPPFRLTGGERRLTVSVGIAWGDPDYSAPEEPLRDADVAMYVAKDRGRDRHAVFEIGMRTRSVEALELADGLRRALAEGEVSVTYQPIVRLDDRRVVGFDVRPLWRHATRGRLAPETLLAVAESHGIGRALDETVLSTAARQLAVWRKTRSDLPDGLFVAVVLSAGELFRDDLATSLAAATVTAGVSPRDVMLEIRPSPSGMGNDLAEVVSELRDAGFRTAAADFGARSISLADLTRSPFDVLKLDSSLTSAITLGGGRLEIVRGALTLASSLGMSVIAEGVEKVESETVLISLNASIGQGGLYARSLSAEGAGVFLSTGAGRGGSADLMGGI